MKLTSAQIRNIDNLPIETQLEILRICAENVGLISVNEYNYATSMPKRTIHDHLNSGKIKSFEISGRKYPLINIP